MPANARESLEYLLGHFSLDGLHLRDADCRESLSLRDRSKRARSASYRMLNRCAIARAEPEPTEHAHFGERVRRESYSVTSVLNVCTSVTLTVDGA